MIMLFRGSIAAMAIATHRLAVLPDVPTGEESGLPGYEAAGWGGSREAELAAMFEQDYVHLGQVAKSIGLKVD
jgi:hypothetical protein